MKQLMQKLSKSVERTEYKLILSGRNAGKVYPNYELIMKKILLEYELRVLTSYHPWDYHRVRRTNGCT